MIDQSRKIVIIGAGHVGSHCAFSLMTQGDASEIVFIDVDTQKAVAQASDIADAACFMPHPIIVRSGDYDDCKDASIIVIAAGVPRKPGQTRLDTMGDSIRVMKEIVEPLKNSGFEGILICISNPADVIANFMRKNTGWSKHRVFSTGTSLDTARLKRVFQEETGIDARSIQCFSMGEHGDSSMVPFSHVSIGGKSIFELMKEKADIYSKLDLEHVLYRTRTIGMDIINGKNSTEFGIGSVLADMVKAIFHDEHRVMPVSAFLEGEYEQTDLHVGVPAIIGKNGIEEIIELHLTEEEQKLFEVSCNVIRKHIALADHI
ncbi:MAG: L-lactate dehydrogenase [Firmicutes bacterium HGW-Firmicutes-15]|nr:MAG: L-lactate dehydrogenase [Firmicutes bacterium HGW-Firmicutes-15]